MIDLRKVVVNALGAIIIPYKVEVVRAGEAFDEAGNLIAEPAVKSLKTVAKHLVAFAGRLAD